MYHDLPKKKTFQHPSNHLIIAPLPDEFVELHPICFSLKFDRQHLLFTYSIYTVFVLQCHAKILIFQYLNFTPSTIIIILRMDSF